jgi:hypothetical protein
MKLIGVFSTAVLSLAIAAPVYAQQEQHDQQEEQKEQKDKPAAKPEEKNAQPEKTAKPEERNAQQQDQNAKPEAKPEERNARQQDKNAKPEAKPEERNAQQQHAQPAKQAQRGGGRIPEDRYKANFGQQHRFHVSQGDYNNRRFQYGGYSFGFVGAWPSNWLYTQDVYVIDIDGVYYLCNPSYPGVNIALNVNL